MSSCVDLQLIERALSGDAAAVRTLVDRLAPVVQKRVACAFLRGGSGGGRGIRPEVEDATQEVLLSLFSEHGKALRSWSPERGLSLEGFVGLVAQRQVLSVLRSRRRSPYTALPRAPEDLDEVRPSSRRSLHRVTEARDALSRLAEGLQRRLSPVGLDVFERMYVEQQGVEEVSRDTGLSADAIYQWRTRIKRAARETRAELSREGELLGDASGKLSVAAGGTEP